MKKQIQLFAVIILVLLVGTRTTTAQKIPKQRKIEQRFMTETQRQVNYYAYENNLRINKQVIAYLWDNNIAWRYIYTEFYVSGSRANLNSNSKNLKSKSSVVVGVYDTTEIFLPK